MGLAMSLNILAEHFYESRDLRGTSLRTWGRLIGVDGSRRVMRNRWLTTDEATQSVNNHSCFPFTSQKIPRNGTSTRRSMYTVIVLWLIYCIDCTIIVYLFFIHLKFDANGVERIICPQPGRMGSQTNYTMAVSLWETNCALYTFMTV